jgi:hypothetical protein
MLRSRGIKGALSSASMTMGYMRAIGLSARAWRKVLLYWMPILGAKQSIVGVILFLLRVYLFTKVYKMCDNPSRFLLFIFLLFVMERQIPKQRDCRNEIKVVPLHIQKDYMCPWRAYKTTFL